MEQASEYGLTSGPKKALRAREPLGKVLIPLEYWLFGCLVEQGCHYHGPEEGPARLKFREGLPTPTREHSKTI